MLFIVVMDVLNRLFSKATERGLLQPIGHPAIKYQCSMYAGDVILFASLTMPEVQNITRILNIFGEASGMRTNISKSSITPIHSADEVEPNPSSVAMPGLQISNHIPMCASVHERDSKNTNQTAH